MKTLKINLKKVTPKQVNLIVRFLKQGKVIAYPTDTIYGLGCLANNKKAINKIHKIKKSKNQKDKKPLLVLVSNYKMLGKYCYVSNEQKQYLKKIWPGPVTVVLKRKGNLPKALTAGLPSLAVRLPKNNFLLKIINQVKTPIVSTSLNLIGRQVLTNVLRLEKYFIKIKPDLVIDAGNIRRTKPSRLIYIRDIKNIKILRK